MSDSIVKNTVSVVVVTYNSADCIGPCITSLVGDDAIREILVVDNASTDATIRVVREYSARFPVVQLIESPTNVGLAAGNNLGIERATGEYVLILNPDTVVGDQSIGSLASELARRSDVGAIGPKQVFEDGSPHVTYHYTWTIFAPLVWRGLPYRCVRWCYDRVFARYAEASVLFVSGACLLARRELLRRIGGYDPVYFLSVEDVVDLCLRIKAHGVGILYYPRVVVTHIGGKSGGQVKALALRKGCEAHIYHQLKHNGRCASSVMRGALLAIYGCKYVVAKTLAVFGSSGAVAKENAYAQALGMMARMNAPGASVWGHRT